MKTNEYIFNWLNDMLIRFPWISFKYEFSPLKNTHFIAVYPSNLVDDNEDYCQNENDFSLLLYKLFPNETIIFGSEEELFKCSADALTFSNKEILNDSFTVSTSWFNYKSKYDQSYLDSYSCSENYQLAA